MKKTTLATIVLSLGLAVIFGFILVNEQPKKDETGLKKEQLEHNNIIVQNNEIRAIRLGKNDLQVEVVKTPAAIQLGLSGREDLPEDGMLFVLPEKQVANFWMKEMNFPLDMVWIGDGEIKGVAKNVPAPALGTALNELPIYSSPTAVDYVLEIRAGESEKWELEVGTPVTIDLN